MTAMDEEILWPPKEEQEQPSEPAAKPLHAASTEESLKIENKPILKVVSDAPMVSLAEAVKRSTKSRTTLRRWISDGKIEGAIKTDTGWQIPIPSLVSSGAWDGTSGPDETSVETQENRVSELEAELMRARLELNTEKKLREAAERNAEDLRFAMRMLTAGSSTSTQKQGNPQRNPETRPQQRPPADKWDFTPAAVIEAANKFRRKLLG